MAAVNVPALVVVILFYLVIVVVGIIAARKVKVKAKTSGDSIVANRNLSLPLAIISSAATYVDGGFIIGTAEGVATPGFGLAWTVAPLGIFTGVTIGGFLFGTRMRARKYVTMLDPFTQQYGGIMTGLLFLGALLADLLWAAAILTSLGTSLSVIMSVDTTPAVIASAVVALIYTAIGQLIAVAYTDVVQMIFMVTGMVLCVPFAMTNEHAGDITENSGRWVGSVPKKLIASYVDFFIVQIFGSIPWQTLFQRVLAVREVWHAGVMCIVSAFSALLFAVPPVLIGAVAVTADWNSTSLGYSPLDREEYSAVLPLVLQYLTPTAVSIIGLAAILGAVMSSLDSIILGSSSMFAYNVYKQAMRKKASHREMMIVQRVFMLVSAAAATCLAIFINSIYSLFYMAADTVFIILFPQLTCAVFFKYSNAYGSFCGYVVGLIMRFGGGEDSLGISPFIKYPYYDDVLGQLFPFKTFAMVCSLLINLTISSLTHMLFSRGIIPGRLDFCGAMNKTIEEEELEKVDEKSEQTHDDLQVTKF